jgi:signal transduction histidine kinase
MNQTDSDWLWLAHELHDGLLPWLHGAHMQLANLPTVPGCAPQIELALHCLKLAMEEGRSLIGFLEGLEDDRHIAIEVSLQQLVEKNRPLAQEHAQHLTLENLLKERSNFSAIDCWHILRVVQQSLHNTMQHAGPTPIRIVLSRCGDNLKIEIIDQGCGFDTRIPVAAGHFGLASMGRRAVSLGGQLEIYSEPGRGTSISLIIPYPPQSNP